MDDTDNEMNTPPGKRKKSKSKRTRYSCPFCDLTCDRLGKIKDHINVHTGYTPHKCQDCDMKYRTFSGLSSHRSAGIHFLIFLYKYKFLNVKFSVKSKNKTVFLSAHAQKGEFPCETCGNIFETEHFLRIHKKRHTAVRKVCKLCSKTYSNTAELNKHMRYHEKDKRFPCKFCNEFIVGYTEWRKHRLEHLEKKFQCDQCEMKFHLNS